MTVSSVFGFCPNQLLGRQRPKQRASRSWPVPRRGARSNGLGRDPSLQLRSSPPRRRAPRLGAGIRGIPRVGGDAFQPPQPACPNSPACEVSAPRRLVSDFRDVAFPSRAVGLRASPPATTHELPHRATGIGKAPSFSNLWLRIGPKPGGPQPLPVSTASGRAGSTTPGSPPRRLGSGRFV